MMTEKSEAVLAHLHAVYPDAKCTLDFRSAFECLVAISLSAQTTDESVNKATPALFRDFPTPAKMAEAPIPSIEKDIQSLGLYHNKAKHLKELSADLQGKFNGIVPLEFETLTSLSGVGTKTAGVFLLEMASRPAIPVDTHVHRVSDRLGYSKENDEPLEVEKKLEKSFPKEEWIFLHHALIAFGRAECHAKNPVCEACPLKPYCSYFKKCSSIKGK
jgi:endonuclease-3